MSIPSFGSDSASTGGIAVGKYSGGNTDYGVYTPNTTIGSGTYYPTTVTTVTDPQVLQALQELRDKMTANQYRVDTLLMALTSKIEALSQMIESDTSAQDRKKAQRKIRVLEEQLQEFREYYEEAQEMMYKK